MDRILLTRPQSEENKELKKILEKEYDVLIDIVEVVRIQVLYDNLNSAMEIIDKFDYIGFTSQNGVKIFFDFIKDRNFFVRDKGFVAIGSMTAKKIKELFGIQKEIIIPDKYDSESLRRKLSYFTNKNILILRSMLSLPIDLPNVKEVYIYTLVPVCSGEKNLGSYDYVVLTSSFITKVFFENFVVDTKFFVPIGPTTYNVLVKYVEKSKILNFPDNYTIRNAIERIRSV